MVRKATLRAHQLAKKRGKYKSMLEVNVAAAIPDAVYEKERLKYITPVERHTYTPDFTFANDEETIIEAKGRLTVRDRKKMLLLKEQYPDKIFYLVFGNAREKLYKGSKTTYEMWAEKHGFECCDFYRGGIPAKWFLKERENK